MKDKHRWVRVGEANRDGLVTLESDDRSKRLAVNVRGGVSWPWPVSVGTRLVSAGAVVVIGYAPDDGRARVLWWRLVGTVGPYYGDDGWPEDTGVVGGLREGVLNFGCWRWYALCDPDDQAESVKTVRHYLPNLPGIRICAYNDQMTVDDVRGRLWQWASEQRLVDIPDEMVVAIEREEQDLAAPKPLTTALAAVLQSFDRRPWRSCSQEAWVPVRRSVVGA